MAVVGGQFCHRCVRGAQVNRVGEGLLHRGDHLAVADIAIGHHEKIAAAGLDCPIPPETRKERSRHGRVNKNEQVALVKDLAYSLREGQGVTRGGGCFEPRHQCIGQRFEKGIAVALGHADVILSTHIGDNRIRRHEFALTSHIRHRDGASGGEQQLQGGGGKRNNIRDGRALAETVEVAGGRAEVGKSGDQFASRSAHC